MMKRLLLTKKYIRPLLLVLFCFALLFGVTACGSKGDTAAQTTNKNPVSQTQPVTEAETQAGEEDTQPQQQITADTATDSKTQPKDSAPTDSTSSKPTSQTTIASSQTSAKEDTSQADTINELTCTLSVECKTILDNLDDFDQDKLSVLPQDGVILALTTVTFQEGDTVFDLLKREMQSQKIHMEFVSTPVYNSDYIEGIHNIYEFDCGPLSGWMYKVNGTFPTYGSSLYELQDGDVVEWLYSCELGEDVGGNNITGDTK